MLPFALNWKIIASLSMLIVFGAMFAYIQILSIKNQSLETDNKNLTQHYKNCQKDNKSLATALEDQNKEIQKFKSSADQRLREREKQLADAKKEAKTYKDRAAGLISVLPESDNLCKESDNLINKEIQNDKN
jgi:uncharacterized protein YlxW (UPF0749 family)